MIDSIYLSIYLLATKKFYIICTVVLRRMKLLLFFLLILLLRIIVFAGDFVVVCWVFETIFYVWKSDERETNVYPFVFLLIFLVRPTKTTAISHYVFVLRFSLSFFAR